MINLQTLKKIYQSYQGWSQSKLGSFVLKAVKLIFTVAVLGYLFYELNQIGWEAIYRSLPTNLYFYILFLIVYFALPISEQLIYSLFIKLSFWDGFKAFLIKKILNSDLVSYSGEAFLLSYGVKNWKLGRMELFKIVKDNNIISSFTSFLTALMLLFVLIYFDQVNFLELFNINSKTFLTIIFSMIIVLSLAFFFRKTIISMASNIILKVFLIHQIRLIIVYSLSILQCVVVLPEIPYNIWFTFLAVKIVFTRIPFLPSQEIVLLGLYANVAKAYSVSQAEIMAIYIMITALTKLVNFVFYGYYILSSKKNDNALN